MKAVVQTAFGSAADVEFGPTRRNIAALAVGPFMSQPVAFVQK